MNFLQLNKIKNISGTLSLLVTPLYLIEGQIGIHFFDKIQADETAQLNSDRGISEYRTRNRESVTHPAATFLFYGYCTVLQLESYLLYLRWQRHQVSESR